MDVNLELFIAVGIAALIAVKGKKALLLEVASSLSTGLPVGYSNLV